VVVGATDLLCFAVCCALLRKRHAMKLAIFDHADPWFKWTSRYGENSQLSNLGLAYYEGEGKLASYPPNIESEGYEFSLCHFRLRSA
jgi:hypothetical protein